MGVRFPLDPKELREFNIVRYKGIAPEWELIQKVIKRSGLKFQNRFELVWGIPHKILTQVKRGDKVLPCRYWHLFYDFDEITRAALRKVKEKQPEQKKVTILETNKSLLDELTDRQSAG